MTGTGQKVLLDWSRAPRANQLELSMKIGVLALQGAFAEHIAMLQALAVETAEVRLPAQLDDLDGLIIPGGESTTIGKLAVMYGFMEPLRAFAAKKAMWGTCAGMIFMAKEIGTVGTAVNTGRAQPLLGIMDIVVERNAFGRQVDSVEVDLIVDGFDAPFPAVFIRAPKLVEAKRDARVIVRLEDGTAVAAQQGRWLVTSFHPELTGNGRFHEYFLKMAATLSLR